MKISIIIPCYNEESTILQIIELVQESLSSNDYEIIVVDDASKDKTKQFINIHSENDNRIRIICHEINSGKGAAIRSGINNVTGDVVIIQDAGCLQNVITSISYLTHQALHCSTVPINISSFNFILLPENNQQFLLLHHYHLYFSLLHQHNYLLHQS